jgi:hypothetical protein
MKSGTCPKCNSKSVYSQRTGIGFGSSGGVVYVYISSEWATKAIKDVDHYLCSACGYLEIYVEDKAKLEQVTKDWKKVG